MTCRVIRNKKGSIKQVVDSNGNPDARYQDILNTITEISPRIASVVEARGRDPQSKHEAALVIYAQTMIPDTTTLSGNTLGNVEGKLYGNHLVFPETNVSADSLMSAGTEINKRGQEFVSKSSLNNSQWNELSERGYAQWDHFNEEWVFLGEIETEPDTTFSDADKASMKFFKAVGVDLQRVKNVRGSYAAVVDPTKMLVQVVEGKRNAYTLSEEAAHLAVAMLSNEELGDLLEDVKSTPEYAEVVADYNYTDENQIAREAIGKVVASELVNKKRKAKTFMSKLLTALSKLLRKFTGLFHKDAATYSSIADMIVQQKVSPIIDQRVYFQKSTLSQSEIVKKFKAQSDLFSDTKEGNRYKLKEGNKVVKYRVSDFVKKSRERMYSSFAENLSDELMKEYADYGTLVHMHQEVMMDRLQAGLKIKNNQKEVLSEVYQNLRTHPDFQEYPKSWFILTAEDYFKLAKFTFDFRNRLLERDPGVQLLMEQKIYNPETDEAGTMDLVGVQSDGSVSIYDYKVKFGEKFGEPGKAINRISFNDRRIYNTQIGRYMSTVSSVIGVTHYDETMIVPFAGNLNRDGLELFVPNLKLPKIRQKEPTLEPIANMTVKGMSDRFNNKLKSLMSEREKLISAQKADPKDPILKYEYDQLNEAIIDLQLHYNPDNLLDFLKYNIRKAEAILESQDIHGLVNILESLMLMDDLDVIFSEVIEDYSEMLDYPGDTSDLKKSLSDLTTESRVRIGQLVDKIMQWHEANGSYKLSDPFSGKAGIAYWLDGLDEANAPVHKRLREIIGATNSAVRREYERFKAEADEKLKALKAERGSNPFEGLINEETGNLITRVDSKYYEAKKEMMELTNAEYAVWARENVDFNLEGYNNAYSNFAKSLRGDPNINEKLEDFANKHNPYINEGAWKSSWFLRVPETPSDEYMSDGWKAVVNQKATVEYLDFYKKSMRIWSKRAKRDFKDNFIPEITRSGFERWLKLGARGNLRAIQQSLEVREEDEVFGVTRNGEPVYRVPFYFRDKLIRKLSEREAETIRKEVQQELPDKNEAEQELEAERRIKKLERERGISIKTRDVHRAFLMFGESAIEGIHKQEIEDSVVSLKYVLAEHGNEQANDRYGQTFIGKGDNMIKELLGISDATAERFDKMINMHLYGQYTQGNDFKVGKYSGNKLLRLLMRYQGLKSVAFNPLLASVNGLNSFFSTAALWREEQYFKKQQVVDAAKMFIKKDPKAMAFLHYFYKGDATSRIKSTDTRNEQDRLSVDAAVRKLSMGNLYAMHRIPNEILNRIIFIALSNNYTLNETGVRQMSEGDTSIYDQFTIGEGIEGMNDLLEGKIHSLHHKVMNRINGEMSWEQRHMFGTTILGQVFMHFRNWIPGMTKARFQKYKYDDVTDSLAVGRLRILATEIGASYKRPVRTIFNVLFRDIFGTGIFVNSINESKIDQEVNKINKLNPEAQMTRERLIDIKKKKLNAAAYELRVYGAVLLLVQLAAALDWDDEDAGWLSSFAYRAVKRANLELGFFFNPGSAVELISNPFTLMREVGSVSKIIGNGFWETAEAIGWIDENKQDRTPLLHYTSQSVPILNIILRFANYYESRQEKEAIEYFLKQ